MAHSNEPFLKTIGIISGFQLWPAVSGGRLRTSAIAESLAQLGHNIKVYSLTGRKADYLIFSKSKIYQRNSNIQEYIDRNIFNAFLQFLTGIFYLPRFWNLFPLPNSSKMNQWLKDCDILIADFPYLIRPLKKAKCQLKILNSHNLEHQNYTSQSIKKWFLSPLIKWLEKTACKHIDYCLASSQPELEFYKNNGVKTYLVPNGVLPDHFTKDKQQRENVRKSIGLKEDNVVIIFTASHYNPNKNALKFLTDFSIKNHQYLINRKIVFLVVGSVSQKSFDHTTLIATGPVDHIKDYFLAADAAVNLVTEGSGTHIKMAEYLTAKLPILSTIQGTRGYQLTPMLDYISIYQNDLKFALEVFLKLTLSQRITMSDNAFIKNIHLTDMTTITKTIIEPIFSLSNTAI